MPRHARNNTNASSFTYAERQMLNAGTKKERLGRDSMKLFNACSLCLERARDPRVCPDGHIFCQECILSSLLSQKADIKRQQALLDRLAAEEEDALVAARAAARARVLQEFEAAQSGLGSKPTAGKVADTKRMTDSSASTTDTSGGFDDVSRKRKAAFDLDEGEIERLAKAGEEEALERTRRELLESKKAKLPNFWLPSLTPGVDKVEVKDAKLQTLCQAASPAHPLSLKQLTTINFAEDETDPAPEGKRGCLCPVCRKGLTNNVKTFALKPCGHVVCSHCYDTLVMTSAKPQCAHCDTLLDKKKPSVELKREGTGFAAGGQVEAKRYDLPFQG